MIIDNFAVIMDSLNGTRKCDEQTLASISILEERLERLRALGPAFAAVSLSPMVASLTSQNADIAVS